MLFVLSGIKKIHFIGIGGSGMSGLAEVLKLMGFRVTGSDIRRTETTKRLETLGIKIYYEHKKENINDSDLVVYSSAIPQDNTEIREAKRKGIPVIRRAEMLAELTKIKFSICVTGSHGKSTTTTMISNILKDAGFEPTTIVGGIIRGMDTGGIIGWGQFLVAEADESDRSFLHLFPSIGVITNVDMEHLDAYGSIESLEMAFKEFMLKVPFYGGIVYSSDDERLRKICDEIPRKKISFAIESDADIRAKEIKLYEKSSEFKVLFKGEDMGKIKLNIPGKHNIMNSLAAIGVALFLKIPFFIIQKSFEEFKGVKRRFEFKGEKNGIGLIDDYAHHPTEIREFIKTVRNFWKKGRIIAVFQPHRYTRTKYLWREIAESLSFADIVFVLPIYPAGEEEIEGVSHLLILNELKQKFKKEVYDGNENLDKKIMQIIKKGDLLCSIGAGNVYKIVEEIYEGINGK